MKQGDFQGLSEKYSKYRPGYCESFIALLGKMTESRKGDLRIADLGAGTGIWTRMLNQLEPSKISAVEPCDDMRNQGIQDSEGTGIEWFSASAEESGLESDTYDIVTMASSFHWPDFEKAMAEFQRILRPGGVFFCVWNSRNLAKMPDIKAAEDYQFELNPNLSRKSSGSSQFVESLAEKLQKAPQVKHSLYLEAQRVENQNMSHYLNAWRSANDVQAQLGADGFSKFLSHIETELGADSTLEVHYRDRGWLSFIKK